MSFWTFGLYYFGWYAITLVILLFLKLLGNLSKHP